MKDLYFDCGSYEKNRNMAKHIDKITTGSCVSGTSVWDGRVWIDMDNLSRESPETKRTVHDIITSFDA